ncbi:Two pore calcium channel protein 1B [Cucurbita argyrosperma subsp. argyrosperma]|nr:Two pore calcium channel protein 1B [Cucurbita argyrosperma subsp. argyrosperma]
MNIRHLRESIIILAGMLGTYLNVLALGLLFLLFSSWLAYVIFEDTQQGKIVFTSFGATLYQMFILFTTSNSPDVWIPAYKASRWYCLFFVLYVLLGVYFVTNLILAVVYDSFKSQLAKQISEMDRLRKSILAKAFGLMDTNNVGFINKEQCLALLEELNRYRSLPKVSRDDYELIFDELDDSRDFKINMNEFADLCNAIALKFQKEDILDIANNAGQKAWQELEFVFGWIYVVEMALKIYSFGFLNYWRDGQNQFDFLVTWIIVIGETITFVAPSGLTFLSNGEWIRYLLIARMLRLIRLLMHVRQYRAFLATFLTLIPSLMPYLGTIFCVLCLYCTLGVQVFGGLVNAGNATLSLTDLDEDDYLLFNFNDYPNGMVTLFNLLVMGNWQAWMQSYKELTGSIWTLVYFISFYLITVLLLLNLVVAFVLEAFFAELDIESSENGEEQDQDGDSRKDRRRFVGTKTRSRKVDILLHHMLSAELDKNSD